MYVGKFGQKGVPCVTTSGPRFSLHGLTHLSLYRNNFFNLTMHKILNYGAEFTLSISYADVLMYSGLEVL